ncbi:MAG: hypothetical protein ACKV2Q_30255 [Planctomycetaceae bacterium]
MVTLTANSELTEQIQHVRVVAEIRDERGRFLGYFRAATSLCEEDHIYAEAMAHFDPDRIAKLKAADDGRPGKTFAEVLEYLDSLERQPCDSR